MKYLSYFFAATFIAGCASRKPDVVRMPSSVPGTLLPSEGIEKVRYHENLKAYPMGRYVDPNNGLIMHEGHTVYRVETTAKWNLRPNPLVHIPSGPVIGVVDPARQIAPVTAEVAAEVQKQKAASQALLEQSGKIDATLSTLSKSVSDSKQLTEENANLRQVVTKTNQRLEVLENQLRQKTQSDFTAIEPRSKGTNSW